MTQHHYNIWDNKNHIVLRNHSSCITVLKIAIWGTIETYDQWWLWYSQDGLPHYFMATEIFVDIGYIIPQLD